MAYPGVRAATVSTARLVAVIQCNSDRIHRKLLSGSCRELPPIKDFGGAGLHRGGAGIEKVYRVLESGRVSIHDDREIVPPWGINGGKFGGTSSKWLVKAGAKAMSDPVEN